ncbi:hypothetical protein L195_g061262, partial [Trifolium pratense]
METVNVVIDDVPSSQTQDAGSDVEPSFDATDDVIQMEKTELKDEGSDHESVSAPAK